MDQPGQAEGAGRVRRGPRLLKPLGPLSRVLQGVFIGWVVLEGLLIALLLQERSLLTRLDTNPQSVTFEELSRSDDRVAAVALFELLLLVVTAALFIWWVRRAYGNLPALGSRALRWGKGWAIGAWFVPFLNLVRPFQIVDQTWVGSDPERSEELGAGWHSRKGPGYLRWWWGSWLLSGFIVRLTGVSEGDEISAFIRSNTFEIVGSAVTIASALLARRLVTDITNRQRGRAARVAVV